MRKISKQKVILEHSLGKYVQVALSPDQLTAAESHVDEETLAKLRQISAESFAKCINQGKVTVSFSVFCIVRR